MDEWLIRITLSFCSLELFTRSIGLYMCWYYRHITVFTLCITMCCMFFLHLSLFFVCYNMNLYFGPAALHYIINNILSYLILLCVHYCMYLYCTLSVQKTNVKQQLYQYVASRIVLLIKYYVHFVCFEVNQNIDTCFVCRTIKLTNEKARLNVVSGAGLLPCDNNLSFTSFLWETSHFIKQ